MAGAPWTDEETKYLQRAYDSCVPIAVIARELGRTSDAVRFAIDRNGLKKAKRVTEIPSPNRGIDEILRDQAERFKRKAGRAEAKRGIDLRLPDPGPFGLLFMGDPHADDDGCDTPKLCYDLEVAKEPHVHPINIGDLTNNWVGRLRGLFGQQGTTEDEGQAVLKWLLESVDWLAVILGNHDKWGPLAEHICKDRGITYVSHGAVFIIRAGDVELIVDARHDHPGRSMYNPSHAQLKRGYRGSKAHIIIAGHIHTSAVTITKNGVTGHINHAIRVGTYKRYDEYADQLGFDDAVISPSVLCVVDPTASPEGFVTVFHDVDQGLKFLRALRESQ